MLCIHTFYIISYMYVGLQLVELDVFMKYYSHLVEVLSNTDYSIFVKEFDMRSLEIENDSKIILINTINHLLRYDTTFFYKLLDTIQNSIPNGDALIYRMQAEIMLLNLTGTYVCMYAFNCFMHILLMFFMLCTCLRRENVEALDCT